MPRLRVDNQAAKNSYAARGSITFASCQRKNPTRRFVTVLTLVLVLVTSMFVLDRQLSYGHDLGYLLFRIDGIASGLREGVFPVRIHTSQINGYGYPSGVMFGDWFLYPVAALNAYFGLSINSCYRLAVILLNFFTAMACFYSFSKSFGDRRVGIVAEVLWMLSVYRIEDFTLRADFGEALAIAWLPLLGLGIHSLVSGGKDAKGNRMSMALPAWAICGIAMTGVITSNIPVTVIVLTLGIPLAICACLIFRPRHLIRQVFLAVILTVLLSAFYTVPFMQYYMHESLAFSVGSRELGTPESIGERSVNPAQLFTVFQPSLGMSLVNQTNVGHMPTSVGLALAASALMGLIEGARQKDKLMRAFTTCTALFAFLGLLLCTWFVPWDTNFPVIGSILGFLAKIQFSWRFVSITSYFLLVLSGIAAHCILMKFGESVVSVDAAFLGVLGIFLLMLAALEGCFSLSSFLLNQPPMGYEDYRLVDDGVYDAQFIPASTNLDTLRTSYADYPKTSGSCDLSRFEKIGTKTTLELICDGEGTVTLPQLYYSGYQIETIKSEAIEATCAKGENGLLAIRLKGHGATHILVDFIEPPTWRAAELVSFVTLIFLFVLSILNRREKRPLHLSNC